MREILGFWVLVRQKVYRLGLCANQGLKDFPIDTIETQNLIGIVYFCSLKHLGIGSLEVVYQIFRSSNPFETQNLMGMHQDAHKVVWEIGI